MWIARTKAGDLAGKKKWMRRNRYIRAKRFILGLPQQLCLALESGHLADRTIYTGIFGYAQQNRACKSELDLPDSNAR